MLRRADNAVVEVATGLIRRRRRAVLRVGGRAHELRPAARGVTFDDLRAEAERRPVPLGAIEGRSYWWYRDRVYWENDDLTAEQVHALLHERERQKARRLQRALAGLHVPPDPPTRPALADEVKLFVWQRDGGACVSCGSRERLEFDHIIPVALGGSSTARNLQLLCERCNRAKGADLA